MTDSRWKINRGFLVCVVLTVVGLTAVRLFVVHPFVVRASSMRPTLLAGDLVLASRLAGGLRIPGTSLHLRKPDLPRRGDVWVLRGRSHDRVRMVKRVIGLPGDTLEMRDGSLYINGLAHPEEYVQRKDGRQWPKHRFDWQRRYVTAKVNPLSYAPMANSWGPLAIPSGYYFVMGDDRGSSFDSRHWGMLARDRLESRVFMIYFSRGPKVNDEMSGVGMRWGRVGQRIGRAH